MKDEQRTARIMDWLEGRLSQEETAAFEAETEADAGFAEECRIMSEMLTCLHRLDDGVMPSADFHQSLMARIYQEKESRASLLAGPVPEGVTDMDEERRREAQKRAGQSREEQSKAEMSETAQSGDERSGAEQEGAEKSGRMLASGGAWRRAFAGKASEKKRPGFFKGLPELFRRRPVVSAVAACCLLLAVVYTGQLLSGYLFYGFFQDAAGGVTAAASPAAPPPFIAESVPAPAEAEAAMDYDYSNDFLMDADTVYRQELGMTGGDGGILLDIEEESGFAGSGRTVDNAAPAGATPPAGGAASAGAAGTTGSASTPAVTEQKIIRTGYMSLEVDSFAEAAAAIKAYAASLGGYVTSESHQIVDGRERVAGDITIKVPYDRYDRMAEQTGALGKVIENSVRAEDVTDQYVDLQARIRVYETKQARLMALLEQSGDLATILAVENELANTNAELESMKGRMRHLLSRTDYSTLDIFLTEKAPETVEIKTTGFAGFLQRVREAFFWGINGLIRAAGDFVVWLAGNLAGLVILIVALLLCRFLWVRHRKKRVAKGE